MVPEKAHPSDIIQVRRCPDHAHTDRSGAHVGTARVVLRAQLEGDADKVFGAFLAFQADLYRVSTRHSRLVIKVPADKVGLLIGMWNGDARCTALRTVLHPLA